jgi:hypothetical protein
VQEAVRSQTVRLDSVTIGLEVVTLTIVVFLALVVVAFVIGLLIDLIRQPIHAAWKVASVFGVLFLPLLGVIAT